MSNIEHTTMPNTDGAATSQPAVPSMDAIAAKMTAMREQTLRNQIGATEQTATGSEDQAETSSPVAPEGETLPEVSESSDHETASDSQEAVAPEEVSTDSNDSTSEELIDFIEFADSNPNAKFKFIRDGKEIVIDAKKAAAILGQGSAIHEDARKLKIERSEFDEYVKETRQKQEGLTLAMEFTIQPRLRQAYDEIVKTQGYQSTFQQQLAQTRDPAVAARIQASMQQNEQYIRQQQELIGQLKPNVDHFRAERAAQVGQRLQETRKSFQDKELRNEFVYNELREKVSKIWPDAKNEIVPGIPNIDLISSDESLLSLIRDGLRYRDKPVAKTAGSSMAALTQRKGASQQKNTGDDLSKLREAARGGDKKSADNLLMARLKQIRSNR